MATLIPRELVTADNYGPVVSVITWILLVSMILAVCTKVVLKLLASQTFNRDDAWLLLAMVVSTAQSTAASIQIANGVGRHRESLSPSKIDVFEKAGYSSNLLFIASLGISKISILFLLRQITPVTLHRRLVLALGAFITVWTVTSLFASAFQCHLPSPWKILSTQCSHQISFWTYYGTLNIITETALIVLPTYIIWNVHIERRQKIVVIGCFAMRLVVIGAIIAQLVQLNRLRRSGDVTFDSWPYHLCTQVVQNLSVITVCIPYIKNFLLGLESGMIQTGDFRMRKTSNKSTPNNGSLPHSNSRRHGPVEVSTGHDDTLTGSTSYEPNEADHSALGANNTATIESSAANANWDGESQSSEAKIIQKTTEWRVDYDAQRNMV